MKLRYRRSGTHIQLDALLDGCARSVVQLQLVAAQRHGQAHGGSAGDGVRLHGLGEVAQRHIVSQRRVRHQALKKYEK